MEETVSELRRLKFLMEQTTYSKAKDLLFEEHSAFNETELLADQDVPFERLGIYLNKTVNTKKLTSKEELDEKMIFQMIERREWNENSVAHLFFFLAYICTTSRLKLKIKKSMHFILGASL